MSDHLVAALSNEARAAAELMAYLADTIGDDDDLRHDMVKGSTDLPEAMQAVVDRIDTIDRHVDVLDVKMRALRQRKERLVSQRSALRTRLLAALNAAGLRRLEMPTATIAITRAAQSARVIDAEAIPEKFKRPQPPKIDLQEILASLRAGEDVAGVALSNGHETITIKTS